MVKIFVNYEVFLKLRFEVVCRFLEDIIYFNSRIRELVWEVLERLGFISYFFVILLVVGLMDSNENVRVKVLYFMIRVIGI